MGHQVLSNHHHRRVGRFLVRIDLVVELFSNIALAKNRLCKSSIHPCQNNSLGSLGQY